ncbi:protein phosphatase [Nitzschia inconspicua]|uniref:Serine/threonine-protein phosphatase T n=1 Tax=Nitzschia inconspicua TaxID=303405 RepID=A0A9K3L7N9_9STRA|nr:protein phosphatase [Nitzschia inconspicua]
MSSFDDSSSTPSAAATAGESSQEDHSASVGSSNDDGPVGMEVVSQPEGDPAANDAQAMKLKDEGNEQLLKGHYLEAIGLYSDALEYSPTNAVILSNRAQAYIKVENYGLAMADATAALDSDPKYAKAYYRRGSAQYALGHLKDAKKDFRKVCQLQPKSKDARAKLQACEKAIREEAFLKAIESEMTAPLSETYDPNAILLNASSYDGPNPLMSDGPTEDMELEASLFQPGKLPREFVLASMEYFRNQKLIHKRYVARLLLTCKTMFESMNSLMEIDIPTEPPEHDPTASPRVTVCGDTHGQFYDVLNIFDMNGYPSSKNPYHFNGDFVDRGSFSVEVILTYLLWKIHDPTCIYLTRGNHETKNMNKIYGFEGEVKAKYDDKIFELFLEVFGHLPLAAVIGEKVFVTHGGLPTDETVMLDDIRKIKRGCEPPETGLMSDLLWSDPQPFPGRSPSKRGVGYAFGPDITQKFLERNGLSLLVRSHEVKEEGYLVEHGGKTITVFSAPNYCDTMGNKGAFIHFDKSLEPKFTQYTSVPHPDVKPMAYSAGMGGLFGL